MLLCDLPTELITIILTIPVLDWLAAEAGTPEGDSMAKDVCRITLVDKLWRGIVLSVLGREFRGLKPEGIISRALEAASRGHLILLREVYGSPRIDALKGTFLNPTIGYLWEDEMLRRAVDNDRAKVVAFLLEQGVRVNPLFHETTGGLHFPPLQQSVIAGAYRSAKVLLDGGADVHGRAINSDLMALDATLIREGEASLPEERVLSFVQLLLDHGADPNTVTSDDDSRATFFHRAAFRGQTSILSLLLQKGNPPDGERDSLPLTPLLVACQQRRPDVVRLLLKEGADLRASVPQSLMVPMVNLVPDHLYDEWLDVRFDALRLALVGSWHEPCCSADDLSTILDVLQEHHWNLNPREDALPPLLFTLSIIARGWHSTLFSMIRSESMLTVKVLLEHGADPDHMSSMGRTPLTMACSWLSLEAVEMLLKYGANPHLAAADGSTPVACVCRRELTALDALPFLRSLAEHSVHCRGRDIRSAIVESLVSQLKAADDIEAQILYKT